ncbi:MAG: DNA polymerase III subunit gamma/tau [Candidatus Latescibacterota bacterium]|jgi:DNA polymerase-3 subunit gamma/tau
MPYLVTARKWRPRRFDQVVAQDHITTTLQRAVTAGRIAHCYLFCGPRGCGKTTTARILAKALNCANRIGADPCDECPSCRSIAEGTNMNVLEIDGASNNSVDDVRELREVVRYVPTEGQYKIYIIDEVHMLSTSAFNALLKTLEEPPPHVVFVFATTEVQEVPETILSRCQRFNFRRIPAPEIAAHLRTIAEAEGVAADEEALFLLAARAEGALRDAESLFDQVLSLDPQRLTVASVQQVLGLVDGGIYFEATEALAAAEPRRVLDLVARVVDSGADVEEFLRGLVEHCRRLFFLRVQGAATGLDVAESEVPRYQQAAEAFTVEDLLRVLQSLLELQGEVRRSLQPRFRVELALVRLSLMGRAVQIGEILERLRALEGQSGGQAAARPTEPSPPRPARPPAPGPTVDPARENPPRRAAPEPAVAPAANAATGEVTLATVTGDWDQLVRDLSATQPPLASYLGQARPVAVDGAVLRLAFGEEGRFTMSQLLRKREAVEQVFAERWGRSLRIDCVVQERTAPRREETPPEADSAVRAALDTFDGELV